MFGEGVDGSVERCFRGVDGRGVKFWGGVVGGVEEGFIFGVSGVYVLLGFSSGFLVVFL